MDNSNNFGVEELQSRRKLDFENEGLPSNSFATLEDDEVDDGNGFDGNKKINSIHGTISDDAVPKIGMEFDT